MSERISVIVPVYNVEEFLDECINSIINQSYKDLEIILVDDGSSDRSGEKCDRWKEKDSRIQVFHTTNKGAGAARNLGIEKATSKYLSFVDSDDKLHSDFYKIMYQSLVENTADFAVCKCLDFYEKKPFVDEAYDQMAYATTTRSQREAIVELFNMGSVGFCNKLFKTEIFSKLRFPNGYLYEDIYIFGDLLLSVNKVTFINLALYGYRKNYNSSTRSPYRTQDWQVIEANNRCYKILSSEYPDLEYLIKRRLFIAITSLLGKFYFSSYSPSIRIGVQQLHSYAKKYVLQIIIDSHTSIFQKIGLVLFLMHPKLFWTVKEIHRGLKSRCNS